MNGEWQGAVWPLAKGFLSGVNRLSMGPDGKLYSGGLKNKAWAASEGILLDRVSFTGKIPFEIKEVHATREELELTFTQPANAASAGVTDNYDVRQFTILFHQTYGSPEIDHDGKKDSATPITVKAARYRAMACRVRLSLEGCKPGYVTWVRCQDIVDAGGSPLWHDGFYYAEPDSPAVSGCPGNSGLVCAANFGYGDRCNAHGEQGIGGGFAGLPANETRD